LDIGLPADTSNLLSRRVICCADPKEVPMDAVSGKLKELVTSKQGRQAMNEIRGDKKDRQNEATQTPSETTFEYEGQTYIVRRIPA